MQYGYFDDAAREYVITEPQTPSPWINYLGSEAFFTLMSNTSGGYSFYKDARMLRLTRYRYNNVPTDAGGQYFYINDGGVVWTPGFMPVKTPLDRYECRHGLGYTRITGEKNGLEAVETAMVPRGVNALVTKVELTNRSDAAKEVSLFSFVEFCSSKENLLYSPISVGVARPVQSLALRPFWRTEILYSAVFTGYQGLNFCRRAGTLECSGYRRRNHRYH